MAKPRKQEPKPQVVRQWASSPVIYGVNSQDQRPNPDYHPLIGLTSKGTFVDASGRQLGPDQVPEHIRKEAKATDLSTEYRQPAKRELSMAEAMLDAGVPETDPDPAVRRSRVRRRAARAA